MLACLVWLLQILQQILAPLSGLDLHKRPVRKKEQCEHHLRCTKLIVTTISPAKAEPILESSIDIFASTCKNEDIHYTVDGADSPSKGAHKSSKFSCNC